MIIKTKRNRVVADEPEADDVFVHVALAGPADGEDLFNPRLITARHTALRPITEYQASVDWAVSVADQFARPLYVVPVSANQFLNTDLFEPYRNMLANLNDQERGEMRQLCIATAAEIMRDCPDQQVRAAAYDILVTAKVIRP